MSSRSSSRLAAPWWVALDPDPRGAEAMPRPVPVPSPELGERSPAAAARSRAPRFEGAARRRTDVRAAVLLAALWVGLWAVFTAGVVLPAAAVHGAQHGPSAGAPVATARGAP